MGIYDRDYYQEERPGTALRWPQSIVMQLVVINAVIWIIDGLFFSRAHQLCQQWLAVTPADLFRPWMWWKFLTYGFAHGERPDHVLFNMFTLWMFGRDIEQIYGKWEFLRSYCVFLVVGSIGWALLSIAAGDSMQTPLLGASGAVTAVVVLFVCHFPRRTILLFFVIPAPAWLMGVILVGMDLNHALSRDTGSHVAYTVHLLGAAAGFLYFKFGVNLGRFAFWQSLPISLKRQPTLKIHRPETEEESPSGDALSEQVDQILEKIHRQGEASLTRKERQILESASREYQKRRRP